MAGVTMKSARQWGLALTLSYERQHRLTRVVAEFEEHRKASAITLALRERRIALGLYDVTRLTVA
jgi:hypothetical protein